MLSWGEFSVAAPPSLSISPVTGHDPRSAARKLWRLQAARTVPLMGDNAAWLSAVPLPSSPEITELPRASESAPFVYVSPHYELRTPVALSPEARRSVVAFFEGAWAANRAIAKLLPVPRMTRPSRRFPKCVAELEADDTCYIVKGGAPGSAGMYLMERSWRMGIGVPPEDQPVTEDNLVKDTVLVRFDALGITPQGELRDHVAEQHSLVHEATHQCFIYNNLPMWAFEGWAEYVAYAPQRDGFIRFEEGFARISARARETAALGQLQFSFTLSDFFAMDLATLYRLNRTRVADTYLLSTMVVAFCLHLDGERGVGAMRDLMARRVAGVPTMMAMKHFVAPYGGPEGFRTAFVKAWQQRGIKVLLPAEKD